MRFSYEEKDEVKKMKVCIIGCGSVGSHVGVALARIGVKNFILIDDDKVEKKNLRNQAYLTPQIGIDKVEALGGLFESIDGEIVWAAIPRKIEQVHPILDWKDCDVAIEAIDARGSKMKIWRMLDKVGVFWVCCNGTAGLDIPIRTFRANGGWIVGDQPSEAKKENWGVAPKVMAIAGYMAVLAVQGYLERKERSEGLEELFG